MNIVIHDLNDKLFSELFSDMPVNTFVIRDNGNIKNCVGCFGCWIKTPGRCVIRDGYDNIGEFFSKADQITVISKNTYGCYSPFIKNVLDRAISYFLPSFELIDNETHHKQRYKNAFEYSVCFYGEKITDNEKKTAEKLVKSNALNFRCKKYSCLFFSDVKQLSGRLD